MMRRAVIFLAAGTFIALMIGLLSLRKPLRSDAVTLTFIGPPGDYNRFGMAAFVIANKEAHPIYVHTVLLQAVRPQGWYDDFAEVVTSLQGEVSDWETLEGHPDQSGVVGPSASKEFYVDWPKDRTWRVCVGYGKPLSDVALWKGKLGDAWKIRSFSNWGTKKWQFGPRLISKEITPEMTSTGHAGDWRSKGFSD